ncbi:efflux RND transporter permease subunit [Blastochloris viridis]|uniref:Efflux pump membrane transporter BepE n=1 Tax=Blastochloris viridis TaxID=1079 RepID=A0A0H5BBA2_BLAVI|nr:efflux RND transporter permease subunit [Blastochloris viridis]ALK10508.1 Efflux pump membrane transporter BepE [Blastochloris viridis]BAR99542.1 RND multidrug efflux transporter [Blastochloris viridis]CUU43170.1 Efflux pump membrane transporter BepE [Blastochloris viridis]
MSFTELFIRRPVLSAVVSLLIMLLGAQGLMNLQVREHPKVDETTITVTTIYTGASADLIQGFISTPIAKAVSSAEGVDYVTSESRLGTSKVSVRMRLNTDPNAAMTEVTSKVQTVRADLPTDAEDPVIVKGTGQSFALMYLTFASSEMNPQQVNEFLTRVVQPRFATLNGVGDAEILGGREFSMRVWLDPIRLAARNVTAADVLVAIRASNFLAAPGKTQNEYVAYAIEMQTTLQTPETFGAMSIRANGDQIVRLRDVAAIELGAKNTDTKVSFNGSEGTFIGITPAPAANPLSVAREVTKAIEDIRPTLPKGMTVEIVYDASDFISASIVEVFRTIAEAALIVVAVILVFLGSIRSVIIPVVTIPLSLIGVGLVLFMLGYSINLLTLLAMVLAIGLVVDDAIVVVENIHRHIEEGESPVDAAIVGMKEIFSPIVSMTITLAAVYAPIGFTQGLTGTLFREFAFTLAGAVIISGIVAVTLSPMMCSKLLKPHHGAGGFAAFVDRVFTGVENWYGRRLKGSLDFRPVTFGIVVVMLATTGFLFVKTQSELAPDEDQGAFLGLINAPKYATSDYSQRFAEPFLKVDGSIPEIVATFAIIGIDGGGSGFIGFKLKEWDQRKDRKAEAIKQDIQKMLDGNAGLQAFVFAPPALPGTGDGLPVQYVLRTIGDPAQAYEVSEQVKLKAMASGKFIVLQNSVSYETPRARIIIDRDRAAALGVPVSEVGATLSTLVGGGRISKFDRDNHSYDVITQVSQTDRLNPSRLGEFYVRATSGAMVPLSALVRIETDAAPAAIEQFNQLNSATLSAVPVPGVTTSEALDVLRQAAREIMPIGFYEDYAGQSRLEVQESSSIGLAFGLALIVIYLVLAAQFESFRDPFVIMMSVPLSMFGAVMFLNLGLATLNIYTEVGLITLIGLITKHGILIVQFANELQIDKGLSKVDAVQEAARIRLRPILMTTAAMVLGVLPLLYASGAGAAARFSMGLVIASGMSIGTIFTLFVVPMFYTLIAKDKRPAAAAAKPALAAQ